MKYDHEYVAVHFGHVMFCSNDSLENPNFFLAKYNVGGITHVAIDKAGLPRVHCVMMKQMKGKMNANAPLLMLNLDAQVKRRTRRKWVASSELAD